MTTKDLIYDDTKMIQENISKSHKKEKQLQPPPNKGTTKQARKVAVATGI